MFLVTVLKQQSADTIVVMPPPSSDILEKPKNEADQLGMLTDMSGSDVDIITAVTLGDSDLHGY